MQINYTRHHEIDKSKWDEAIRIAINGNLYGYSWYLDVVCPGWDALLSPDYDFIMPLTGNRKFGFHYLFRPTLSQQLGLFSRSIPLKEEVDAFLEAIPAKFRLIQICLNKHNHPSDNFSPILHSTYELDLNSDYEQIRSQFSANHRRNIKKAASAGLEIVEGLPHKEFIDMLVRDNSPGSQILARKKNLIQITQLIEQMQFFNAIRIIGINNQEGKTISCVLFGHSHNIWIYLVPVNSNEGREKRALFAIIDHLIQNRTGNNEILDFEGSDIIGLAQFYSGFGARKKSYNEIRQNTLPWPINYLK